MEITKEQHIQNWKGMYDNAVVKLSEYKKSFAQQEAELINKNRELSMRVMKAEKELQNYKHFFRQVEVAQQTLVTSFYKKEKE